MGTLKHKWIGRFPHVGKDYRGNEWVLKENHYYYLINGKTVISVNKDNRYFTCNSLNNKDVKDVLQKHTNYGKTWRINKELPERIKELDKLIPEEGKETWKILRKKYKF